MPISHNHLAESIYAPDRPLLADSIQTKRTKPALPAVDPVLPHYSICAPTLGVDFFLLADAQHKPANQHDCRKKDQPIDQ